ncbi:uncharacterized protein PB18E9.04c isoform X2 [Pieris rapae]|uniref:uncharacterized protein PB18E9.04c isoform X2 n=1 Tax=Pieris rapae TaxID=64459 RepID=UPI001E27D476|nr:uncharacterized protein PB18E9.04c isoform X2 [Pieris rapae]
MNMKTAPLGKFCVVEWIQGSNAGERETVSRDLVQLQPELGPSACRVYSFTDSNQYSPAVLHFHNDDSQITQMWLLLSSNISENNAKVPSDKASRKRQRPRSPASVQREGRGHTDLDHGGLGHWTDERRYIVVQADDSVRRQYACVPRSWIKGTISRSLAFGASCDVAWPAEIEKLGPWARLGYSPSPMWGLRRVICVYATDNFDVGQDWIRKMTNGQPIFSVDHRPEKVPRIYNSSRRFTGHQFTNTPLPSVRAVGNETNAYPPFLPAPYNTEEFRKLITSYNCIQTPLRPANSVPDHTVTPTPVFCSLAKIPYVRPVPSTSSRANSSSSTIQSPKTTSFSTSARYMFCNAPSTHTSEIRSHLRPSVPTPLPPSYLAPTTSIPIVASTLEPFPLPPSNLAPTTSIPIVASTSEPFPLPPSNLAPTTSIPIVASTSVPVPLPPSNFAPATSIPILASTSEPIPLKPSNLAPATSIPIVASTSVPIPLPPSNLAPATSIPILASTSEPIPLKPCNLAPATSISIVESTSVPIPLPPSNLAPATSGSVPSSKLQTFTSALSLLHVSAATATPLLPSISATPILSLNSAPASTTLASSASSITPLILSSSVVTTSQASSPVGTGVSSSIAHPKAKSPNTTTQAEPNSSQTITKRHIRSEFIKLINKITVLDGQLEKMGNRTVKGIHSSSLKFQESMKPLYDFCVLKNNDVAVEAN